MRFISLRTPILTSAAALALLAGGAAMAAGFGGGGFHGGGAFHGAPHGGVHGGIHGGVPRGAAALPPRGQWVGNDGFGGPGYHWRPGRRWAGHGFHHRHVGAFPHGRPPFRRFGYNPYLEGYGVGYLGGGGYEVGYYGGNGVFYVENFYGYTDDTYRPTAYTAASGYAPIIGDPVYFDLTYGQPNTPPVYRPPVIQEPVKPLPHIITLPTTAENPHIIH